MGGISELFLSIEEGTDVDVAALEVDGDDVVEDRHF